MPGSRWLAVILVGLIGVTGVAQAHEVRPGYLQLRELDSGTYELVWKVPAKGGKRLGLYVRLPDHCRGSEPVGRFVGGAYVERSKLRCAGALVGHELRIDGLEETRTDVLARVEHANGSSQTVRLTPDVPAFRVAAPEGPWQVVKTYFVLGMEHILLGIDHLLFVLALLFLVGSWARLIGTITAFTVAHSLTLAAAALGWVHVPQAPVEAAIALSIVFVAAEVLHSRQGRVGLAARKPWVVAFVFGLLHGLGFAGALRELGLPEHAIPLALAFFNIGVEAGQILFVLSVFGVLWLIRVLSVRAGTQVATGPWRGADSVARPAAYFIGTLAAFWVFDRTAGFWA
jgi:hydrogenase/urease accessory protein HupE